jgi:hypothetical protein
MKEIGFAIEAAIAAIRRRMRRVQLSRRGE